MLDQLEKVGVYSRFNFAGKRYYYDSVPELATSVTTILGEVLPEGYAVKKLISEMGLDGFNKFLRERATYGTAMHTLANQYLLSGVEPESRHLSLGDIERHVRVVVQETGLNVNVETWKRELTRDLLALVAFYREHNVTPVAIEPVVACKGLGLYYAGAIDLVCHMDIKVKGFFGEVYKTGDKRGQPKETNETQRVMAIVDYKSGKNGFRTSHEAQLAMYKFALMESWAVDEELYLFNLSPKDWTGDSPTFTLKDQTNSKFNNAEVIRALLMIYKAMGEDKEPVVELFEDTINGINPADCVTKISLTDYLFNYKGN